MDLSIVLTLCVVAVITMWSLMFFRKSLAKVIARHSEITKLLAIFLAFVLFLLVMAPLIVLLKH